LPAEATRRLSAQAGLELGELRRVEPAIRHHRRLFRRRPGDQVVFHAAVGAGGDRQRVESRRRHLPAQEPQFTRVAAIVSHVELGAPQPLDRFGEHQLPRLLRQAIVDSLRKPAWRR
jgi:hypothetical protein